MQRRVVLVRARSGDLIGAAAAGMSPAFQWAVHIVSLLSSNYVSLSLALLFLIPVLLLLVLVSWLCSFSSLSSIFSRVEGFCSFRVISHCSLPICLSSTLQQQLCFHQIFSTSFTLRSVCVSLLNTLSPPHAQLLTPLALWMELFVPSIMCLSAIGGQLMGHTSHEHKCKCTELCWNSQQTACKSICLSLNFSFQNSTQIPLFI